MKKNRIREFLKKAEPKDTFKNNLLSEKCITLWRIRATIILILYSFLEGGIFVFFPKWAVLFGIIGVFVYAGVIQIYLPFLYRHCGYYFEDGIISVNSGVVIYRRTKIPVSKIQYCVILQGPLQRIFGLCSVRILTAGTSESINQISMKDAYRLKSYAEGQNSHMKQGDKNAKKKI